ncbi:MAG: hypothetical protein WBC29_02055 [Candidatus Moraniibacteriota bacterium]
MGTPLTLKDAEMIAEDIVYRNHHYPDESLWQSAMVVLLNCGDRFAPVSCVGPERWSGTKQELRGGGGGGVPTCPSGHPLLQGRGKILAFIEEADGE